MKTDFRHSIIRLGVAALLCLCTTGEVEAKVKLPALIGDGMVLQREQPVRVWGSADAGETVEVKFVRVKAAKGVQPISLPTACKGSKLQKQYTVTANAEGQWSLTLPPLKAGGPYRLQVNDQVIDEILIGDVWLCSGQSNMELPVRRVTDLFADEVAAYENTQIRHIIIPKVYDFHAPQSDIRPTAWKPLTQENVMEFSALGYFFAKEMFGRNGGVPIGLINASWGGTPVEAWISEEGLKPFPQYLNEKRIYEDDAYCRKIKEVEGQNFYRWNRALYMADAGLHEATPWYAPAYDDTAWQKVEMFSTAWGNNGLNPIGGSHWLRKTVEVPAAWEGREATIRLGCIVDADSVYVNGTFVGTTGYQYPPRIYRIPAGVLKSGQNVVTVRIISNGGQPGFVPEKPYKIICGSEEVSLEGGWKYRLGAPMPKAPDMMFFCYKPVCLYNAMIAPLASWTVKGVIWYQGESNVARRNEYAPLLSAMIADWRKSFGNEELPFYIIELADFLHPSDTGGRQAWAELRRQQARVAEENRATRLVRNSDLGEWNDIHPLDKKTLGQRVVECIMESDNK